MNYTDNYKLNLPSFNDSADISALNENFSKIDEKLKANETATGNIKVPTTDQTYKPTSKNPQSGIAVSEAVAEAVTTAKNEVNTILDGRFESSEWMTDVKIKNATRGYFNLEGFVVGSIDRTTGKILSTPKTHLISNKLPAFTNYTLKLYDDVLCDMAFYNEDGTLLQYSERVVTGDSEEHTYSPQAPLRVAFAINGDTDIDNETDLEHIDQKVSFSTDVAGVFKLTHNSTDTTVKEGSTNPVSGGAVYTALQNVEIDVDPYISETSKNPIQNKVIKQYVDKSIADLVAGGGIASDGRIQLKPNFANDTSECIDTSKVYVLPDGNIYAYMENGTYPEITIQDNYTTTTDGEVVGRGSGYYWYKNGVTEDYHTPDNGLATSKQTNYIPVTAGDILQYTGKAGCNVLIGSWYDGGKNFLSPIMVAGTSGNAQSLTVTAPDNAKYVRFFASTYTGNIIDHTNKDSYSLEVKWEYCYVATIPRWAKTGNKFIPADYEEEIQDHEKRITDLENKNVESILKGKKIVYDGDSICADWSSAGNGGAYPKIIADIVGGRFDNRAVGGGRLVTSNGATNKDGEAVTLSHSVVDNLVNLPTDGDLYCFEGGVNDQWNGVPLGDFDERDFESTLDTKTMCGALEYIFRYALTHFVGKPICFIITHKCRYQNEINGNSFADYREKMIGICEKYAVPYYDAWKDSGLGYWNTSQLDNYFVIHGDNETGDGCHPNEEGYKRYYVPQLISLFERIMPRV